MGACFDGWLQFRGTAYGAPESLILGRSRAYARCQGAGLMCELALHLWSVLRPALLDWVQLNCFGRRKSSQCAPVKKPGREIENIAMLGWSVMCFTRQMPERAFCVDGWERTRNEYSRWSVKVVNPHSVPVLAKIAKSSAMGGSPPRAAFGSPGTSPPKPTPCVAWLEECPEA